MGWPDQFTTAAREHLTRASKTQTCMIDQVMDAWEHQLKSSIVPSVLPSGFKLPTLPLSGSALPLSGSALMDPMSEMMRLQELTLAPFKLWMQAAEMWQRNWADAMTGSYESGQARPGGSRATRQ